MQQLAEARDDEQRVVDTDPDSDHRDEQRGDRVDVGQPREDEEEEERGCYRRDGEHDRDRRRHERPEDNEQHDERREQPEQLLGSLLEGRELRIAVELHGHSCGLDRLADGLLHGDDRLAVLLVDDPVELRLRVRDAPVVGGRVVGERALDALEAGLVLRRLELRGLQARDRFVDRLLSLGRVEALAGGGREDDIQDAALLLRELGLDEIGRSLRVRARNLELVTERATERSDDEDEDGKDADPRADDAPRVHCAPPRPARQRPCRKSLVRCPPLGAVRHLTSSRRVIWGIDEF